MTTHRSVRSVVLTLVIGSFSIAALMGIAALLGGGSFGENEARVLLTTLAVGCTSVAVLCYLATSGTSYQPVGVVGGLVVLLPLATSLWLIWTPWEESTPDGVLKAYGVGVVLAATLAQVCLLLATAGGARSLALPLAAAVALAGLLAVLLCAIILGEVGADGVWRLLGVLAILDVLATLVTLALAKFGSAAVSDRAQRDRLRSLDVRLPALVVARLDERAGATGLGREQLVAEAVERYLSVTAHEGHRS